MLPPVPDPLDVYLGSVPAAGSGFDPAHCNAAGWDPLPYLQPSAAVEYAALQRLLPGGAVSVQSEIGSACMRASDPANCLAATKQPVDCTWGGTKSYRLVTTTGDEVRVYCSERELPAFLGTIDTEEEALLVAALAGYSPGHDDDPCVSATIRATGNGYYELYAHRSPPPPYEARSRYWFQATPDGYLVLKRAVSTGGSAVPGRKPEGLQLASVMSEDACGAFFARSAQLEAAAVHAFARMQSELITHDAPSSLITHARRAMRDEQRHTLHMQAIAQRFGARVPPIHVAAPRPRSLLEMAIENAAEGCARETWSAVVATYQAVHVPDPLLRTPLARIAADEREHAALSCRLASWLETRLTASERRLVRAAYAETMASLKREVVAPIPEQLVLEAGLPPAEVASAMLGDLQQANAGDSWHEAPA